MYDNATYLTASPVKETPGRAEQRPGNARSRWQATMHSSGLGGVQQLVERTITASLPLQRFNVIGQVRYAQFGYQVVRPAIHGPEHVTPNRHLC